MTEAQENQSRSPSYRDDSDAFFRRHPFIHFVYLYSLSFTFWSLVHRVHERFGSGPGRFLFSGVEKAAVIALLLGTGCFIAKRWQWLRKGRSGVHE
jgi:hypothetical protein